MKILQDVVKSIGTTAVDRFAWIDGKKRIQRAWIDDLDRIRAIQPGDRVRQPKSYEGQPNYLGYYWFAGTQKLVWHESMAEYGGLLLLDHLRNFRQVWAQPFVIHFGGGTDWHVPDYLMVDSLGNRVVLDVHLVARTTEANRRAFERTREICAVLGWEYLLYDQLTDLVLWNLEMMGRYRHPWYAPDSSQSNWILEQVAQHSRYGELRAALRTDKPGEHIPALRHMMWHREIAFDLSAPFSDSSRLSVA